MFSFDSLLFFLPPSIVGRGVKVSTAPLPSNSHHTQHLLCLCSNETVIKHLRNAILLNQLHLALNVITSNCARHRKLKFLYIVHCAQDN